MSEKLSSQEMSRREAMGLGGKGALFVIASSGCQALTGVNPPVELFRAFWRGYHNRQDRAPLAPGPLDPANASNPSTVLEISGRIPNSDWILNPNTPQIIYSKNAEDYKKQYMLFVIQGVARVLAAGFDIFPRVMTAQSPLENGYGTDPVAMEAKNYFGIKGAGFWTPTHEDYGNGLEPKVDSFRTYYGGYDSFFDYATMVTTLDHFKNIVNCKSDHEALIELQNQTDDSCDFVRAQGEPGVKSYATSRIYVESVEDVIDSWRLKEVFIEA